MNDRAGSILTRRRLLVLGGLAAAGVAAAACTNDRGDPSGPVSPAVKSGGVSGPQWADAPQVDFSARFARFPVADEPNGDLAKVVWPDWIERAPGDVKRLYEFQVVNGDLMKYMPCFCGCGRTDGHSSNRDCYVREVRPDGSVVFDDMAPTWDICQGVTRAVMEMKEQGLAPRPTRMRVDALYENLVGDATPTPYPPT